MYWFGLLFWSHGSTGSKIRACSPQSGTTAATERYYRRHCGTTVTSKAHTHPIHLLCSFLLGFCISFFLCFVVALLGWSGGGSRQHLKRKAAGASGSTSVNKTAQKNKAPQVPIDVLPLPLYRSYRQVSPYREEQDPSLVGTKFWNKRQQEVYNMLTKDRKNAFVPNVKSVSLQHMAAHSEYFKEATDLCDQFGIGPIISFNKEFSSDLLAQFYATVYFRS